MCPNQSHTISYFIFIFIKYILIHYMNKNVTRSLNFMALSAVYKTL
jgi:hypothetical protein